MRYSAIAPDSAMVLPFVGNDRRLPERMDRAQFRRRAHVRLTLIADDLRKPRRVPPAATARAGSGNC